MNDDLISRKSAIEAFRDKCVGECGCCGYCEYDGEDYELCRLLMELPAAEPERKKGKPIFKHGESIVHISYANGTGGLENHKWADWVCPECGWFVGEQYVPRHHNQRKSNFCSRCGCEIDWTGVDMRGEQDDKEID